MKPITKPWADSFSRVMDCKVLLLGLLFLTFWVFVIAAVWVIKTHTSHSQGWAASVAVYCLLCCIAVDVIAWFCHAKVWAKACSMMLEAGVNSKDPDEVLALIDEVARVRNIPNRQGV